jgi:hypothetical protein
MSSTQALSDDIILIQQPDGSNVRITKKQLEELRAAGWIIGEPTRINADAEAQRKILEQAQDLTGGLEIRCSNPNCSHKHHKH